MADAGGRPAPADDVLVQVLARAEAEMEAAVAHRGDRGGLLRDDRRVVADRRAGDERDQVDSLGLHGQRTEHAPRVGAVFVRIQPGMEVVGDREEVEARLLRPRRLGKQVRRVVQLAHQAVAVLGHGASLENAAGSIRRPAHRSPYSQSDVSDRAQRRGQALRDHHRGGRPGPRGAEGHLPGPARSQRRRQVDDHAPADRPGDREQRRAARARVRAPARPSARGPKWASSRSSTTSTST